MSHALTTLGEMKEAAAAVASSFKMTNDQVLCLFLLAQSEGIHPMQALKQYDIIEGKPSMKAAAMLAKFQERGGVVQWIEFTDQRCAGLFSHPIHAKEPVEVALTIDEAHKRGLTETWDREARAYKVKHNWKAHAAAMLRARVASAAIRMIDPGAINGYHSPEELEDLAAARAQDAEVLSPQVEPERHAAVRAAAAEPGESPTVQVPALPAPAAAPAQEAACPSTSSAGGAANGAAPTTASASAAPAAAPKPTPPQPARPAASPAPSAKPEPAPAPTAPAVRLRDGQEVTAAHLQDAGRRLMGVAGKDQCTRILTALNERYACGEQHGKRVSSLCPPENRRSYLADLEEEISGWQRIAAQPKATAGAKP